MSARAELVICCRRIGFGAGLQRGLNRATGSGSMPTNALEQVARKMDGRADMVFRGRRSSRTRRNSNTGQGACRRANHEHARYRLDAAAAWLSQGVREHSSGTEYARRPPNTASAADTLWNALQAAC